MSGPVEPVKAGFSAWPALSVALGLVGGLGLTVFRPVIGLWLGVAVYYLLAVSWSLNTTPGSGAGG